MSNGKDRILVVESDPVISDLVARQALQAQGYNVRVVSDASAAIPQSIQFSPDLLIVNLRLPGLSGKDFLVALNSQGIHIPVIVIALEGMQMDIIQAFRLGANDVLLWPMRDAEVITIVERALKQVNERRERERLARQLQQANQDLQQRVRELTTIFSIGKAVTALIDQRALYGKVVEAAVKVSQADMCWFLLRDEVSKSFILSAHHGLPASLAPKLNQPWDDGISSLVAMSGETLSIHGDPLKRFKISSLGQSALIAPVKVQKQINGVLVVLRQTSRPFGTSEQNLLEAICDYVSIAMVNMRLYRALEERAQVLQKSVEHAEINARIKNEIIQAIGTALRQRLEIANHTLRLAEVSLTGETQQALDEVKNQLFDISQIAEATCKLQTEVLRSSTTTVDIKEIARQAAAAMQSIAQRKNLSFTTELPSDPLIATADAQQIYQVILSLLSNAFSGTQSDGKIKFHVSKTPDGQPHLVISDNGPGLDSIALSHLFENDASADTSSSLQFNGLGISLSLVRLIITSNNGMIWVDSQPGRGTSFHISLPGKK